MTLFFTESCHHVANTAAPEQFGKWSTNSGVNYYTSANGISTRWGTGYFVGLTSATSDGLYSNIPAANQRDTLILGFALAISNGGYYAGDLVSLGSDSQATTHGTLRLKADGAMEYRRGTGSGTILATSSGSSLIGLSGVSWHYCFLKVKLHDTTGTVELWVDGVQQINATGLDTKNGGTKTVFDWWGFDTSVTSTQGYCDIVAMDDQGTTNNTIPADKDLRVECLFPSGNGNSSQGTGSDGNSTDNYALVDETGPSTSDYVGIATDDQKDTYAFSDLASLSGSVLGVAVIPLAAKSDAGAKSVATVARTAGVEEDGADQSLSTSYLYLPTIYEDDPSGSAWTIGSVNASEFGFKARP